MCPAATCIFKPSLTQLQSSSSAVENGVGPHDANDLPGAVTVLVLHLFMEEIQVS